MSEAPKRSVCGRYGFSWVTLALFLGLAGHWTLAWFAYQNEQEAHSQPVEVKEYMISPQSKEGDDRREEKIDRTLAAVEKNGEKAIQEIDRKYPRA